MYQKNMKNTIALVLIICISISFNNEKEADKLLNNATEENINLRNYSKYRIRKKTLGI